ncbi:hypothetical protein [Candidatus Epulonipiscium viviparus]|nr:hypothetical protein [Candidatus Epulopiscium viviparus]
MAIARMADSMATADEVDAMAIAGVADSVATADEVDAMQQLAKPI